MLQNYECKKQATVHEITNSNEIKAGIWYS